MAAEVFEIKSQAWISCDWLLGEIKSPLLKLSLVKFCGVFLEGCELLQGRDWCSF